MDIIMEERSTYVLRDNNDIGTVQIADDVVAMIASLAVRDIEGVEACAGNMAGELMDKVGIKNARKGAKIDIFENRVKVDVFVNIAYGYNILVTCGKVQDKVKTTIENMTGLTVTDVNVRVVAVSMPNNK